VRLYEELTYLAYHLHWSSEDLMNLEHSERLLWVAEVSKINERLNES
jgi:hypothetical protein